MKITTVSFLLICLLMAGSNLPIVEAEITTEYLEAANLNFTCTVLRHDAKTPDAPRKNILLLHGFPMFRVWWDPLLEHWDKILARDASTSVHAVACDLRGYSPGASPDNIEDYDYSILKEDTFALAEAAGFEDRSFHLLGHDHGGLLAWYIAGNDPHKQVLSLTVLSVPHLQLVSNALCGDNIDEDQVIASNYFNQFALPDSASLNNASLTELFNSFGMSFESDQLQKMLWWYNGSIGKYISMPRIVSDEEVETYETARGPGRAMLVKVMRGAIPMEERPCKPARERTIGSIKIPTLFICGLGDSALLCNNPYVTNYPRKLLPNYEHVNYKCGHDFFLEGQCKSMDESQAVMDKITLSVLNVKSGTVKDEL